MYPTTGHTHLPTPRERLQSEIASCIVYMADYPDSEYWANRFAEAMAQWHLDDLRDNQRACDTTGCFGTATGDRAICLDCWIDELERELDYCDLLDMQEGLRHG